MPPPPPTASESAGGALDAGAVPARGLAALAACVEMTKPRLSALVLVSTAAGYALAAPLHPSAWVLAVTVLGTALTAGGANTLNQVVEAASDAHMDRTRHRPLPSGRLGPGVGLLFGLATTGAGLGVLAAFTNALTAWLGLASWATYVLVYTPLKRRTTLNTLVGAVSGALPPVMGWTAATGSVDPGAWVLFAILFVWQIPHFLAIAWLHREDYRRGGHRMLTVADPAGILTGRVVVLHAVLLLPVTLAPPLFGLGGPIYLVGAAAMGVGVIALSTALWRRPSRVVARRLFLASVIHLAVLMLLLVLDPTSLAFLGA